jgi:hypothetical protein
MTGNRVLVFEKCTNINDLPPDDGFNISGVKITLLAALRTHASQASIPFPILRTL